LEATPVAIRVDPADAVQERDAPNIARRRELPIAHVAPERVVEHRVVDAEVAVREDRMIVREPDVVLGAELAHLPTVLGVEVARNRVCPENDPEAALAEALEVLVILLRKRTTEPDEVHELGPAPIIRLCDRLRPRSLERARGFAIRAWRRG